MVNEGSHGFFIFKGDSAKIQIMHGEVKSFRFKARKFRGLRRTFNVRLNDEKCGATQKMEFLRSHGGGVR